MNRQFRGAVYGVLLVTALLWLKILFMPEGRDLFTVCAALVLLPLSALILYALCKSKISSTNVQKT